MATLKKEAEEYKSQKVKNIADLESVPVELEVTEETFADEDGKDFTIKVVEIDNEKYRVPVSVLKQLKVVMEDNPDLKKFKVKRTGTGMNTEYIVIPILKL